MNDLAGALCVGESELFESIDWFAHLQAAAICEQCPVFAACEQLRDAEMLQPLARYGGPEGTWAGLLVGTPPLKKPKGRRREHGTERGYYQHKNRSETTCLACREALRVATNERRRGVAS